MLTINKGTANGVLLLQLNYWPFYVYIYTGVYKSRALGRRGKNILTGGA
jgi:hypothetical protein